MMLVVLAHMPLMQPGPMKLETGDNTMNRHAESTEHRSPMNPFVFDNWRQFSITNARS
jgi:hypothetical protein